MLSFLNSIVLPALLAISIPIIIHFFNRRKVKKIPFSSLRFLKMLENQRIRQVRLYQIFLIIIRTLFILFLVLAFARPTLNSSFLPVSGNARTTAVIVLDDSYSMQGFEKSITKFQVAMDILKQILETFDPSDQVFILPVSSQQDNMHLVDLNQDYSELVKRFSAGYLTPDFSSAFKNAAIIFNDYPNFNRELYFLSDMRLNQSQFSDSLSDYFSEEDIKCFLINPEKDKIIKNIGIDTVIVETQLFEINKPIRFTVRLHNYNTSEASEALINLFNNENRLALDQMVLPPSQSGEINISYVPKSTGYQFLHFELDDDELLTDNHYFVSILIPEKRDILFVSDQVQPELSIAIKTLDQGTILNFDQANYSQWIGRTFEKYDLIVLNDPPVINNELIARLNQYIANKNILVIPGLRQTIKQMNHFFSAISAGNILIDLRNTTDDAFYYPLDPNLVRLPLFATVFTEESIQPNLPKINKYFKLSNSVAPIIQLENGDPLFAKIKTDANGSLFIFASEIDQQWNDFSVNGFFIPMLYRILFTTAQDYQDQQILTVGKKYITNLPIQAMAKFTLQISDAEPFEIFPEQSSSGMQFSFDEISKPGYYVIRSDNKIIHAFSVNVSSKELKQPYIQMDQLLKNVINLNTEADIAGQIEASRTGQELWYIFLSLALLMLISEMLLVRKIENQKVS
jgi:hypothetical protein